eukprot:5841700-Pleurochrysis_carterae.AAC.1
MLLVSIGIANDESVELVRGLWIWRHLDDPFAATARPRCDLDTFRYFSSSKDTHDGETLGYAAVCNILVELLFHAIVQDPI